MIGLPTKQLEIYAPLLCEMEELDKQLNLQQFMTAADKLYNTLIIPEREVFLNGNNANHHNSVKRKEPVPEAYTFKVFLIFLISLSN